MNKVNYLKNFESSSFYHSYLFNGYLQSLNPKQTVSVLDLNFDQDSRNRRYILGKIYEDADNKFESFHENLVYNLFTKFLELPYRKINSCGYSLSFLYPILPDYQKKDVLDFFLKNTYVSMRRRGYKILQDDWDNNFRSQIIENWHEFHDVEIAKIMINHFDIAFSKNYIKEFEDLLGDDWYIRKLYLKIASIDRSILDYIKTKDEVTYCYLMVKLDEKISEKESLNIYENNSNDERVGLLIWCFGKMKLWETLEIIEKDTST
ncbi:MAG TPA: hypothetical protein VE912_07005 [Bacteroidales bacterium]|nr:hypothetical protein [Bacteroidales bacterium]